MFFDESLNTILSDENLMKLNEKIKIIIFNNIRKKVIGNVELIKIDLLEEFKYWRRSQRIYKILGPLLLPHVKYSLYFEMKQCRGFKKEAFETFEKLSRLVELQKWISIKHETARNYKHEFKRVASNNSSEDLDLINEEVNKYMRMKIPLKIPMYFNAFILRKHDDKRVQELCMKWAELYYSGGDRDQISLPVAAYLTKFYPSSKGQELLLDLIDVVEEAFGKISIIEKFFRRIGTFLKNNFPRTYFITKRLGLQSGFLKKMQNNVKVGWVLNGNISTASTRLMGYNVHDYLISQNIFSKILYRPRHRIISRANLTKRKITKILKNDINMDMNNQENCINHTTINIKSNSVLFQIMYMINCHALKTSHLM
jgi:hypothetical protein